MSVDWLVIGTGDIVRKRVAAALGSGLRGVCGGRERAAALAQEYGAEEVFEDVGEALRQTTANAVYIATPVYRHRPEAIRALEAGKHILVEKPLGLDAADAGQIIDAAESSGLKAGCAFYRRCFPRYDHLKRLLAQGTLGDIVQVRTCYWSWFNPAQDDPKTWRVDVSRSGGGPLADMGSQMIDLIVGAFGLPQSVCAYSDTLVHDYQAEDSLAVIMQLAGGAHVTASFGWHSKTWRHELEVVGTEGKILWSPADTGVVMVTIGRDIQELELPNAANVHRPLVEDFERAVEQGSELIAPLAEAAKTNQVIDAIYRSSDSQAHCRP